MFVSNFQHPQNLKGKKLAMWTILKLISLLILLLIVYGIIKSITAKNKDKAVAKRIDELKKTLEAKQAIQYLVDEDFAAAGELIEKSGGEDRNRVLAELCDAQDENELYEKWVDADPTSAMANYVYGANLVKRAWDIRGGQTADKVDPGRISGFHETLVRAETALNRSLRLDPGNFYAYKSLIRVCMGLSKKAEAWEIHRTGDEKAHDCLPMHLSMTLLLTPRWLGSSGEMFDFCRETSARDGENSLIHALVAQGYFEQRLSVISNFKEYTAYFRDESVKTEVVEAYEKCGKALRESVFRYDALNIFAACFTAMDDKVRAKEVFDMIGHHSTAYPWLMIGPPTPTFLGFRRKAGLGALEI